VGLSIATNQHGGFENNMQAKLGDANVKKTCVCDYPIE
jgi:hypothetical protein